MLLYLGLFSPWRALSASIGAHPLAVKLGILWLVAVWASWMLAPFCSLSNPLCLMRLAETITHPLFFLILWHFFSEHKVDYALIILALLGATVLVMGYFVYIHFAYSGLHADRGTFSMRSSHLWLNTHVHRIGYQVETAILMSTAFLFDRKSRGRIFPVLLLLFLFLIWLGGRAALLGTLVGLAVLFVHFWGRRAFVYMLIFSLLTTLALFLLWRYRLVDFGYMGRIFERTFHVSSLDHLLSGRVHLWKLLFHELQGHWLFGNGPQSYYFYADRPLEVIHAHNFVLQFLGEWGILGAGSALALLVLAWVYGMRQRRSARREAVAAADWRLAAGVTLLGLSVTGLFGGIYFFSQSSLFLALGFAVWLKR